MLVELITAAVISIVFKTFGVALPIILALAAYAVVRKKDISLRLPLAKG